MTFFVTLVGSKQFVKSLYLKKLGTWTMIVFGWFTHPDELLWVMKIKDCQMLAASEISFLWKTFSERFSGRKNGSLFIGV